MYLVNKLQSIPVTSYPQLWAYWMHPCHGLPVGLIDKLCISLSLWFKTTNLMLRIFHVHSVCGFANLSGSLVAHC